MIINSLELPIHLISSMQSGEWQKFSSSNKLSEVFKTNDIIHPCFYDDVTVCLENEAWFNQSDSFYLGSKDSSRTIDPKSSILIADLGPDRLVALDYHSGKSPSVVFLTGENDANWIEIAPNIETLLNQLRR